MNKQSNTYTVLYIIVMVVIVGAALAITSLALKPKQQADEKADRMCQILASVHIEANGDNAISEFNRYITRQIVVNAAGDSIGSDAFAVDVAAQAKLPDSDRSLPVFVCRLSDGAVKYIIPAYGSGLWGPIWGYVAVDADGSTIYGAYYGHQGETPGLGAKIAEPQFSTPFEGKHLFKDGVFAPVSVVKIGMKPVANEDYVDAIAGATITSRGVGDMLANCLRPYKTFLENVSKHN
ncbi:MAG: NADH:ubiquinone reductase (Na(+)-transporting) subunit C [Muribaculaceae bacterium]|nr:NADH:ubiquinone reductase (Na(+)-transporting) subunit C [Muribaculaceae bacterium]